MDLSQIDAPLAIEAKSLIINSSFVEFISSLEGEVTERIISLYISQVGLVISTHAALELKAGMYAFMIKGGGDFIENNNKGYETLEKINLYDAETLLISFLYFVCPSSFYVKEIFSF